MPYPPNPFFTGRKQALEDLHAALAAGGATAALTQTAAIAGLGGVGKTQTAVEYAYRHRNDYQAVLWASANSETTLSAAYGEIASLLGLPEAGAQNPDETREAVKRWLAREARYLLILDNADEPRIVTKFLPPNLAGRLLITSRSRQLDFLSVGEVIALPEMPEDEAVSFLFRRARRKDDDPAERAAAEGLAKDLGYLPLALEQAAAYIAVNDTPFADYRRDYERLRLELLEEQGPVAGGYPETVRTTWTKSFAAVRASSEAAAELLNISAFLAPDRIPYELLVEGAEELGEPLSAALAGAANDPRPLNRLLKPLTDYSLIRRDGAARTYDIHRLVQAVLLAGMDEDTRRRYAARAIRAMNRAFPDPEFSNWPLCERLLPHARECAKLVEGMSMIVPVAGRLLNDIGFYLQDRAQYAEAELLYQRSTIIYEEALGKEHPHVAATLSNLAGLYQDQSKLADAERLYQRSLAINEQTLGKEHPDVATTLNGLAALYYHQGKLAEAEPLYQRSVTIYEEALGKEHPHVSVTLNNLAALYRAQGKFAEAEPLYQHSLAIREQALGKEHPDVALTLNNLAGLYHYQGKYAEAEPLYQRSLSIFEQALGPEHPYVATTLENYATLLSDTGRTAEAAAMQERAEAIWRGRAGG